MVDVQTYGQILQKTPFYIAQWTNGLCEIQKRGKFLVHRGYADGSQLPVAALTRQVTANLLPVKIKPLKASGKDPDIKELGTLAKPSQDDYSDNAIVALLPHPF